MKPQETIGSWKVEEVRVDGKLKLKCICKCGFEAIRLRKDLNKSVKKTGDAMCKKCANAEKNKTHGLTKHPSYKKWDAMIQRCTNQNNASWDYYGAKGISVCDRWMVFENFYDDIGHNLNGKLSIDRIDNNKGYSPENCRVATPEEQIGNRDNHNSSVTKEEAELIKEEYASGMYTQRELAEKHNIKSHRTIGRIVNNEIKYYKKDN